MPARLTLKDLDAATAGRVRDELAAAVELANAAEQLLSIVPAHANPIVIAREHLAELQAARDAFITAAEDVLEVRELPAPAGDGPDATIRPVDEHGARVEPPAPAVDRSAGGALARAGYQDGDLDRALIEQTQPGRQA